MAIGLEPRTPSDEGCVAARRLATRWSSPSRISARIAPVATRHSSRTMAFCRSFRCCSVFTTVLGFVLENRPKLRDESSTRAFERIPIIGRPGRSQPQELKGNLLVLILVWLRALGRAARLQCLAERARTMSPKYAVISARPLVRRAVLSVSRSWAAHRSRPRADGARRGQRRRALHRVLLIAGCGAGEHGRYRRCVPLAVCSRSAGVVAPGAIAAGVLFAALADRWALSWLGGRSRTPHRSTGRLHPLSAGDLAQPALVRRSRRSRVLYHALPARRYG